jgi:hypothetical protein
MKKLVFLFSFFITTIAVNAQPDRWQQRIKYTMDVKLDVSTDIITGKQTIDYWNNSPDTLKRLFFHVYWNAFHPGSSMDVRSRELGKVSTRQDKNGNPLPDWDRRLKDTIVKLVPSQYGYQKVKSVLLNGKPQQLKEHETILEVDLDKPIAPKAKTTFVVDFEAKVPAQIRRSGKNNIDGVKYSVAQWYPKLAEYDVNGWNPNPYIAREFYGVWGDFDVKITMDKNYMIAATGVLQNPNSIGFGYSVPGLKPPKPTGNTITWNFIGNNVHDFVWVADDAFTQLSKKVRNDLTLRVFYKPGTPKNDSAWNNVLWMAEKMLPFIEKKFGKYPWPEYAFIQGGDGGMEYAMATLITRPVIGTAVHEWMHVWYQQLFGTNESLYAWMDEGFATFAEEQVIDRYLDSFANRSPFINDSIRNANLKLIADKKAALPVAHIGSYKRYYALQKSPYEEPMTTHADHFTTNFAYTDAAYFKGAVFLEQLGYIVGANVRDSIMLEYYRLWKFKHPTADDFLRVAEKTSGMELDWYKEYWVNGIKSIDYTVGNINFENGKTQVTIKRIGKMPMPVDVLLTFKDGTKELHYIPLDLMYGAKPAEDPTTRFVHEPWRWTIPEYVFESSRNLKDLKSVEIDPSGRMADTDRRALVIPD